MDPARYIVALIPLALVAACASTVDHGTLAQLRQVKVEIEEERVENGIDRAIQGYESFLAEAADSSLASEAMRRLADLKIEKEYGLLGATAARTKPEPPVAKAMEQPEAYDAAKERRTATVGHAPVAKAPGGQSESDLDFERRATLSPGAMGAAAPLADVPLAAGADLESSGAREAIALYKQVLAKYPLYDRKDQVLYNMSRAYEELGQVDEAMTVMNRLVKEHPDSRYFDEVEFRRGEYFFTRKKYLDAEDAYKAIADRSARTLFYELALYKLGWAYYKQELYDEALDRFMAMLDYKLSSGYDFESSRDELEKKRVEDTYRVISLSFSNAGGANAVADFFAKRGGRPYDVAIYRNLGEFYLEKRRYHDAAGTYQAFVKRNPFHKEAPHFEMQVIDTYKKGGFPKLIIESTKEFARSYSLKSEYWKHFDPNTHPEVVGYLKTNLNELASHYHALFQDKGQEKSKAANFQEARIWYLEFLDSFPQDADASATNYRLAELLLENKMFGDAAQQYEKTAYEYPAHEKAAAAGYAAVYAHREAMNSATPQTRDAVKQDIIRSSLKFADAFPAHEKASVVLGAAADDLYEMKDHERAIAAARKLIDQYPNAEQEIRRAAWLVVAHSSFALEKFADAEKGYLTVVHLSTEKDMTRVAVIDNLAASIYKQGEQVRKQGEHQQAVDHFLRIGKVAPTSTIRPAAEYDAAAELLQLKEWGRAVEILEAFRKDYPSHELQPEVTKKIALANKEAGNLALAAAEYERVEIESKDDEQRRGALSLAAELYEQAGQTGHAVRVYRRYVEQYPKPLEFALETRNKLARLYKSASDDKSYVSELRQIVDSDARAGSERTDRTRYLAAMSALAMTEPMYEKFQAIKLVKPFEKNLARKKTAMKEATDAFGKLAAYEAGEATAAAAFYIAEIYYEFGKALTESDRPDNLSAAELEQYELALEEQAYPFEEKAIKLHEKNLELLSAGVYNAWIDKSIGKLALLVPARYAKAEELPGFVNHIGPYRYEPVRPLSSPEAPARKDEDAKQASPLAATEAPGHGVASAVPAP